MHIEDIQLKQGDAYLSNPNLKRANTSIQWTEEQIIEFLKCKKNPVYFAKNYIKIVNVDDGLISFNLWPFQEKLVSNFHKNRFNICKMPRQVGKALALDTPIPTKNGWTTIGKIQIGDKILSPSGNEVSVTFKTETMINHQCYKIYFDNGEEIIADTDHLWEVNNSQWKTGKRVINTSEIYLKYSNKKTRTFYIESAKPIIADDKVLPVKPYLLGIWLGGNNSLIESECPKLDEELKKINIIKDKHIPQIYLRSSVEQRLELLRGLMDSNGKITKTKSFEFCEKNYDFIHQFVELLSSLGIKSKISKKIINNDCSYNVRFITEEIVFNLQRKLKTINFDIKELKHHKRHYIKKIEKVESVPVACIQVDSEDHLFLCGKTFIPTHNTTTVISYLLHYVVFNDNVNIGILANKASTSREILSRLQLSYENLPKWMQQGIISWNKGSLELENGSKIIAASTSASAVRGMSFNIIFLDEFAFVPNHIADDFFASVYPTISSGKKTKVIVVSCVTDDSFILTPKGIYEMSEFVNYEKPENPVIGYEVENYQVYGHNGVKNGNILVNSGFHDTKIISSSSSSIECSLRHPWFVCDNGKYDWKKTSELTGKEYIAIEYGHDVWDDNDELPQIDLTKYINTIPLEKINSRFAYLLGLFISKGSLKYNSNGEKIFRDIAITCDYDICGVFKELGLTYTCNDNRNYTFSSEFVCDILQELGFDLSKKDHEKEIPKRLFRMSRENIIHMIRGIIGDNDSNKNKETINIDLSSKKLIFQIRAILNNFGILSTYNTSSLQHGIELNESMSEKYYELIGFSLERRHLNDSYPDDIIPYSKDIILSLEKTHLNDYRKILQSITLVDDCKNNHHFSRKFLLKNELFFRSLNNPIINELFEYVSDKIKWEPIVNIEDHKNKVYDFSLKETGDKWCHSVLFNNILGSNTPKGMNHFYRMWHDAERGKNQFVATEVHWTEVPGRDQKWKEETIANTSEEQFRAEHLCEFLGSVGTLISPSKLKCLTYEDPEKRSEKGLDVYKNPEKESDYLITVDVARGIGNDYSAFIVFDITKFPYKIVAKYKNNEIKPMLFPSIVEKIAKAYNHAWVLAEVNDIGEQVANILHFDLEYDNILMCSMKGRAGQIVGSGFSGRKSQMGVRMTSAVKKLGCSNLKLLIEDDKLLINDYDIISELTTFIQKHNSFEAEEGCNDDLAMCLHKNTKVVTENGIKTIKWIVDKKYSGKVLSIDSNNKFTWSNVIGHSSRLNKNKKWINIQGKSRNVLTCTSDHKIAYIEDIFNPEIKYTEAENMLGKYNVILPENGFHKSNPLFNETQISALVGTLLGNSLLTKSGKLVCAHEKSKENYANHKRNLFNSKLRIQNKNNKITFWIDGFANEHTRFFRDQLYQSGKKSIKNILNFIDEISLSYWYMDSGNVIDDSLMLCADNFTYEDNELLVDMLKKKFNIESDIVKIINTNLKTKKVSEKYRITINSENSDKFFKLVSPYLIDSMRYKLPEKYHSIEIKKLNTKCLDFGSEKITKILDKNITGFESRLYDITVENTHNFIADGMIVHNCLVIFAWLVAQSYFKEMTDNDVRKRIYEENKNEIEQDMSPFGFIADGLEEFTTPTIEMNTGDTWILADKKNNNQTLEVWNLDEYGDVSSEWSYMWDYT